MTPIRSLYDKLKSDYDSLRKKYDRLTKVHDKFLKGAKEDEDLLETWYEEKVRDTLKNQDDTVYKGDLSPRSSSDIKIELTKKWSITIPVKSKERDDVDDVTKGIVKYLKERLKFDIDRVKHSAHGMKKNLRIQRKGLERRPR